MYTVWEQFCMFKSKSIYLTNYLNRWELLTEEDPYPNQDIYAIQASLNRGERLPIPNECPEWYKKLVSNCWEENPDKRPNMVCFKSE